MMDILISKKSETMLEASSDNVFLDLIPYYYLLKKELYRRPWKWIVLCCSICDFCARCEVNCG